MAIEVTSHQESIDNYSYWSHVFGGSHTSWLAFDQRQFQGAFFFTLQGQTVNNWNAQIPKGATILSATMTVEAFQNSNAGTHTVNMNAPQRSSVGPGDLDLRLAPERLPFAAFRGWRPMGWSKIDTTLISSTFTVVAQPTAGVNNLLINMNQLINAPAVLPVKQRANQRITANVGNTTVVSLAIAMSRIGVGGIFGSMRARVQGLAVDDHGQTIPDGIDLGVSNNVAFTAAAVSPAVTDVFFNFASGGFNLVAGQDYFVVWESDSPADGANFMQIGTNDIFLSTGVKAQFFGEGVGGDWQNYPGVVNADQWHNIGTNIVSPDIQWDMPQFIINQSYVSPNIVTMVQAQIDDPGYVKNAGIVVAINRTVTSLAQQRVWRSNTFGIPNDHGPILDVTYITPLVPSVVGFTEADATFELLQHNFGTLVITKFDDVVPAGIVISQDPLPGSIYDPGLNVTICVSLGPEPGGDGMADPHTGPSRFPSKVRPSQHSPGWEPFDISYFRTKYASQRVTTTKLQPEQRPEPLSPEEVTLDVDHLQEILLSIGVREAAQIEAARQAADLLALREREDALAAELAHLEIIGEQQRALLAELEQNRIEARTALLLAMQLQRRQRSELAAIAATMQYFF